MMDESVLTDHLSSSLSLLLRADPFFGVMAVAEFLPGICPATPSFLMAPRFPFRLSSSLDNIYIYGGGLYALNRSTHPFPQDSQ